VTPSPTSTTMPAPSWPSTAGNTPSGSSPESVNASVWHSAVWVIFTSTSPLRGGSTSSSTIFSGSPAAKATAARDFIARLLLGGPSMVPRGTVPGSRPASGHRFGFAQFADPRGQRNEFTVVQVRELHASCLPVRACLVDALLRRGHEVPVDVARAHRFAAQ